MEVFDQKFSVKHYQIYCQNNISWREYVKINTKYDLYTRVFSSFLCSYDNCK